MIRVYLDIDKEYSDSIQNLPNQERIEYLSKVIDKNQSLLASNGKLMSAGEKMKLMELIKVAQKEVKSLQL